MTCRDDRDAVWGCQTLAYESHVHPEVVAPSAVATMPHCSAHYMHPHASCGCVIGKQAVAAPRGMHALGVGQSQIGRAFFFIIVLGLGWRTRPSRFKRKLLFHRAAVSTSSPCLQAFVLPCLPVGVNAFTQLQLLAGWDLKCQRWASSV